MAGSRGKLLERFDVGMHVFVVTMVVESIQACTAVPALKFVNVASACLLWYLGAVTLCCKGPTSRHANTLLRWNYPGNTAFTCRLRSYQQFLSWVLMMSLRRVQSHVLLNRWSIVHAGAPALWRAAYQCHTHAGFSVSSLMLLLMQGLHYDSSFWRCLDHAAN